MSRWKKWKPKPKPKHSWLKKVGMYHIFSIPVQSWIMIAILLVLFTGMPYFYFYILPGYNNPPAVENFVAEVSNTWIYSYESETGGGIGYRVELIQDNEEILTCRVLSIHLPLWRQLEKGKRYQFEVSMRQNRCYINAVSQIERN